MTAAKQDMGKRDKAKIAAAKPLLQQSTKNCQLHLKAGPALRGLQGGTRFLSCSCFIRLDSVNGFPGHSLVDAMKLALHTLIPPIPLPHSPSPPNHLLSLLMVLPLPS